MFILMDNDIRVAHHMRKALDLRLRQAVLTSSMSCRREYPRFLQIRLGSESCDQISASPNGPKRAKSRDTTAGSLFTHVYLWLNSVKLKGVSSRF